MNPIDMKSTNPDFIDLMADRIGLESIRPCYTCGSCTGICPVREVIDDFDPRRMIYMIVLGMKEQLLSSDLIWFCCLCNSCYDVCPQGIRFSRIAKELQIMAVEEGYVKEEFLQGVKGIDALLQNLCRRTLFKKVKEGFWGPHKMPCWRLPRRNENKTIKEKR